MTVYPFIVGCDISKHHLDLHHSAEGTTRRIANTAEAVGAWIDGLTGTAGLVVMEATGRYDTVFRQALAARGIAHARVNPEQARHFARATGRRAKTDAIDAVMLAELGRRLPVRVETSVEPARARLTALSRRRDQLVAMRKQERTRRAEKTDALIAADLDQHLALLDGRIDAFDRAIVETMRSEPALARQVALLRSAPGIGPVAATVLIAHLPELGRLSPRPLPRSPALLPTTTTAAASVASDPSAADVLASARPYTWRPWPQPARTPTSLASINASETQANRQRSPSSHSPANSSLPSMPCSGDNYPSPPHDHQHSCRSFIQRSPETDGSVRGRGVISRCR